MRLVSSKKGTSLINRTVAPADKDDRHRLADPELIAERPHLAVGIRIGLECVDGLRHAFKLGSAPAANAADEVRKLGAGGLEGGIGCPSHGGSETTLEPKPPLSCATASGGGAPDLC